ncbi:hypothetical protein [Marinicella meishanensis]|uniref:hypothetical protein n=1 Tax=Marinicella meishanensis TaxID=2873263 RepID=UPI001CBD3FB5|nr:hypothetical protein [Marinicella sp. NBU2979]
MTNHSGFTAEQVFWDVIVFRFEDVHPAAVAFDEYSTTHGTLIDEPAAFGVADWVH